MISIAIIRSKVSMRRSLHAYCPIETSGLSLREKQSQLSKHKTLRRGRPAAAREASEVVAAQERRGPESDFCSRRHATRFFLRLRLLRLRSAVARFPDDECNTLGIPGTAAGRYVIYVDA